jgi:hypothetical protein
MEKNKDIFVRTKMSQVIESYWKTRGKKNDAHYVRQANHCSSRIKREDAERLNMEDQYVRRNGEKCQNRSKSGLAKAIQDRIGNRTSDRVVVRKTSRGKKNSVKCKGTTQKGKDCRSWAAGNGSFCGHHGPNAPLRLKAPACAPSSYCQCATNKGNGPPCRHKVKEAGTLCSSHREMERCQSGQRAGDKNVYDADRRVIGRLH